MKTRNWLWAAVAGWALAGCGGGLEPVPGAESEAVHAQSYTTSTGEVLPDLITLPSRTVTRLDALWPTSTSVRKYVLVVQYTQPADTTGYVPPPRFRAYGVDMATGSYAFAVDADRQTYLGSFIDAMSRTGSVLVMTPPGFKFYGSCSAGTVLTYAMNPHAMLDSDGPDCGTDPIVRSGSTNTGGHDPDLDYTRLKSVLTAMNNVFTLPQFGAFSGGTGYTATSVDAEAR